MMYRCMMYDANNYLGMRYVYVTRVRVALTSATRASMYTYVYVRGTDTGTSTSTSTGTCSQFELKVMINIHLVSRIYLEATQGTEMLLTDIQRSSLTSTYFISCILSSRS